MQRTIAEQSELGTELELVEAEVWADLLDAVPPDIAARLGVGMLRTGNAVAGNASGTDVLMFNRVVALGIHDIATDTRVDELLAHYADAGVARWMVQWSPAAVPSTATDLLRACGFYHHNNWMKLYRSTSTPLPPFRTAFRIERVGGEHDADFARIIGAAFGFNADLAAWCAAVVDRPGWRAYMAFDGDVAVATGAVFAHGRNAWMGFGATAPAHRGQGAQAALAAARIAEAKRLGCEIVVVETAEDHVDRPAASFRNMQRLGFEVAYARANYVMVAGAHATGILGVPR